MQSIDTLLVFFVASLVLAITPGPDNLFVLTQAAQRGARAGLAVTVGLCTGLLVHTTAVALGVAALFQTSALAFAILKYAGASYLLYLAWQSFRAGAGSSGQNRVEPMSFGRLYRRGIIMNVTNPKVSLFFLAFLPQFMAPERGPILLQTLILGGLFIVSTILVFGTIALVAGRLGKWLRKSAGIERRLNRMAGVVFLALAARLALSHR